MAALLTAPLLVELEQPLLTTMAADRVRERIRGRVFMAALVGLLEW